MASNLKPFCATDRLEPGHRSRAALAFQSQTSGPGVLEQVVLPWSFPAPDGLDFCGARPGLWPQLIPSAVCYELRFRVVALRCKGARSPLNAPGTNRGHCPGRNALSLAAPRPLNACRIQVPRSGRRIGLEILRGRADVRARCAAERPLRGLLRLIHESICAILSFSRD